MHRSRRPDRTPVERHHRRPGDAWSSGNRGGLRGIREFLKPLVGISGNQRLFQLGQHGGAVLSQSLEERFGNGHVLSQSLEEKGSADVRDVVAKYQHYEKLVFAARPSTEAGSLHLTLKSELESKGFSVATVCVLKEQPASFYAERAQEILEHLRQPAQAAQRQAA